MRVPSGAPSKWMLPIMAVQVVVPVAAYTALHGAGVSAVDALSIIGGASAVLLVLGWVWRRAVDGLGLIVLAVTVLGIAAALISGSARVTLLRDSVFTGGFGLAYLASLLTARPLTFHTGRRFAGEDEGRWDELWQYPSFRHAHRVMTFAWGAGLVLEAAVRVLLVYTLPVSITQAISAPMAACVIAGLAFWSIAYGKRVKRRGRERREAPADGAEIVAG